MRFLIDEPISWHVARDLSQAGHDAIHVRDCDLIASDDEAILERAASEERVVITQDTDFGTLLALGARTRPSVILLRMRDGRPETQMRMIKMCLPFVEADLQGGAIVVIGDGSLRIRRLT